MTQTQYATIAKCITFGSPAQAEELLTAFNAVIAENQRLTAPAKAEEKPSKKQTKSSEEA